MSALRAVEYIQTSFQGLPNISINVVTDRAVLEKEYPLLAAVARASWDGSVNVVIFVYHNNIV
jgi:hypothetical protein